MKNKWVNKFDSSRYKLEAQTQSNLFTKYEQSEENLMLCFGLINQRMNHSHTKKSDKDPNMTRSQEKV